MGIISTIKQVISPKKNNAVPTPTRSTIVPSKSSPTGYTDTRGQPVSVAPKTSQPFSNIAPQQNNKLSQALARTSKRSTGGSSYVSSTGQPTYQLPSGEEVPATPETTQAIARGATSTKDLSKPETAPSSTISASPSLKERYTSYVQPGFYKGTPFLIPTARTVEKSIEFGGGMAKQFLFSNKKSPFYHKSSEAESVGTLAEFSGRTALYVGTGEFGLGLMTMASAEKVGTKTGQQEISQQAVIMSQQHPSISPKVAKVALYSKEVIIGATSLYGFRATQVARSEKAAVKELERSPTMLIGKEVYRTSKGSGYNIYGLKQTQNAKQLWKIQMPVSDLGNEVRLTGTRTTRITELKTSSMIPFKTKTITQIEKFGGGGKGWIAPSSRVVKGGISQELKEDVGFQAGYGRGYVVRKSTGQIEEFNFGGVSQDVGGYYKVMGGDVKSIIGSRKDIGADFKASIKVESSQVGFIKKMESPFSESDSFIGGGNTIQKSSTKPFFAQGYSTKAMSKFTIEKPSSFMPSKMVPSTYSFTTKTEVISESKGSYVTSSKMRTPETILIPEENQKPRIIQSPRVEPIGFEATKSMPRSMTSPFITPMEKTIQLQTPISTPEIITRLRTDEMTRQTTKNIFQQPPSISGFDFNFRTPKFPLIFGLPALAGQESGKRKQVYKSRKYKYTPSIGAMGLGLKAPSKSIVGSETGLFTRYMISQPRKRKKK